MKADLCLMEMDHAMDRVHALGHELFWKICASNEPLDIEEMHGIISNLMITAEQVQNFAIDCIRTLEGEE